MIGAAEDDVVEGAPVDLGAARDERGDGDGGEVVGADGGERSALAAEGSADGVADVSVGHGAVAEVILAQGSFLRSKRGVELRMPPHPGANA